MPIKLDQANLKESYRPPQKCLDVFWTLSEGNDQERTKAAIQLVNFITSQSDQEKEDKDKLYSYCRDRLLRGLASGRQFSRIGFATAFTLLLRQRPDIKTELIMTCIKDVLKEKNFGASKTERAGLYLGQAFAISAVIQAGRASKLKGTLLESMVEDLMNAAEKKSYLKPVCHKALETLVFEVSRSSFSEHIWPKVKEKLALGWKDCTIDRVSLLLTCKDTFPDSVNEKFMKKYWGYPFLSSNNDENLVQAVLNSNEKSDETMVDRIVPVMCSNDRDPVSVWIGFGEKLLGFEKVKTLDVHSHRHLLALKILNKLVSLSNADQTIALVFTPSVNQVINRGADQKNDMLLTNIVDVVFYSICNALVTHASVMRLVKRLMQQVTTSDSQEDKLALLHPKYLTRLVNLMSKSEAEAFVDFSIGVVKGSSKKVDLCAMTEKKREEQIMWHLRQLQHVCCSPAHTSSAIQQSVLTLFTRFAYFRVEHKTKELKHCEHKTAFELSSGVRNLSESFITKCLDQLATLKAEHQSKADQFSNYLSLLFQLVSYMNDLIASDKVSPVKPWPEEMMNLWKKLFSQITKINKVCTQPKTAEASTPDSAFVLMYYYLAFNVMVNLETTSELFEDVRICQEKSSVGKKKKTLQRQDAMEEPSWIEVLVEVLLQLLSQQSHFARVVASMAFKCLIPYLNPAAVDLITQVLIPKKSREDDADGTMVDDAGEENDEMEEDGQDLLDDDIADEDSEESDEQEDGEDEDDEDEDDEEDDMGQIDEKFRQSVKQALGNAVDDEDDTDEEEDLSDLSDSEMFKLDEVLAEVFRQRKKSGGKQAREEKQKEILKFRLRVLDLVETLAKSDRCGDFALDFLKPLVLLMMTRSNQEDEIVISEKARSLFMRFKSAGKRLTDTQHTTEQQSSVFKELLELARSVRSGSELSDVVEACVLVITLQQNTPKDIASEDSCLHFFKQLVVDGIKHRKSKSQPGLFIALLEAEPSHFYTLCPLLLDCIKDDTAKTHSRTLACTLLSTLTKKMSTEHQDKTETKWMIQTASVVSEIIGNSQTDDFSVMFIKECMSLTLALLARTDLLTKDHFGDSIPETLQKLKRKMNTDVRKIANKVIAALSRKEKDGKKKKRKHKHEREEEPEDEMRLHKKKAKRRKTEDSAQA